MRHCAPPQVNEPVLDTKIEKLQIWCRFPKLMAYSHMKCHPNVINDKKAAWIARHRDLGHHPEHSPTAENPDLVRCDCGGIWRILTPEQIRKKFAHLGAIAK